MIIAEILLCPYLVQWGRGETITTTTITSTTGIDDHAGFTDEVGTFPILLTTTTTTIINK